MNNLIYELVMCIKNYEHIDNVLRSQYKCVFEGIMATANINV